MAVNASATPADLERAATALALLLNTSTASSVLELKVLSSVRRADTLSSPQCQSAAVRTRIGPLNATEAKRVRLALDTLVHDLAAASSVLNASVTRGSSKVVDETPTSTIFPVGMHTAIEYGDSGVAMGVGLDVQDTTCRSPSAFSRIASSGSRRQCVGNARGSEGRRRRKRQPETGQCVHEVRCLRSRGAKLDTLRSRSHRPRATQHRCQPSWPFSYLARVAR